MKVTESNEQQLELGADEVRVLGALVEKSVMDPHEYPLSVDGLMRACNQKSNRCPVVRYTEGQIYAALQSLADHGLVRRTDVVGGRARKFEHRLSSVLKLDRPQLALLSTLLLRGPQTVGELRMRSERLFEFADISATRATLQQMTHREPFPLVQRLPRKPGDNDDQYWHVLADMPSFGDDDTMPVAALVDTPPVDLILRVRTLEEQVEELDRRLNELLNRS